MRLKDKLFTIINDQPYLNPVGLHIAEFEALRAADKTEAKIEYAKSLAYIYHMWEYDSPYYDRKNKESEIIRDFIGKATWKPSKALLKAYDKYIQLDECAEKRLLDAAVTSCDRIASDLSTLKQESDQLELLLKELDVSIKASDKIEKKVDLMKIKLDFQEQKMKISKSIVDTLPKVEKAIETVLNLRKKVTKAVFKGESTDSVIGEFLYDKLMNELSYEQDQDEE